MLSGYSLYWGIPKDTSTTLLRAPVGISKVKEEDIKNNDDFDSDNYFYYKYEFNDDFIAPFEYTISEVYSDTALNNTIKLVVDYGSDSNRDKKERTAETNIGFIYQGVPGTSGSAYVCIINEESAE